MAVCAFFDQWSAPFLIEGCIGSDVLRRIPEFVPERYAYSIFVICSMNASGVGRSPGKAILSHRGCADGSW